MITKAAILALLISADISAALSVQASTIKSATSAVGSTLPLPSGIIRIAKEGISGDSAEADVNKANKANKFSPQDNTLYDSAHKVDNGDKYHAPKVAPNDKQPDYGSEKQEEKKPVKDTTHESEKGKKGSVILDDYDPSRLGVSANEAKEKTYKDVKDVKDRDIVDKDISDVKGTKDTTKAQDAKGAEKDSKGAQKKDTEIVKDTKAAQSTKGTETVEDTKAAKSSKDTETVKDPKAAKGFKDTETVKDPKAAKSTKDTEAVKDTKAAKSTKDTEAVKDTKAAKSSKDNVIVKDSKDVKGSKDTEILKDSKGAQGVKGTAATKGSNTDAKNTKASAKESSDLSDTVSPTEGNKAINAKEGAVDSETIAKDSAKDTTKDAANGAAKAGKDTVKDATTEKKFKVLTNTESTTTATATATTTATASTATAAPTSTAAADIKKPEEARFGRFLGSALMIVVSEIGDKTFFIAALMAMRHPPVFVFSSSYSAMVVMTILSMVLGLILPSLLSRKVTTLLAALLFVVFGVRMLTEAWAMDKNLAATDEMEEVENDLALHDSTRAIEKAEGGGLASDDNPASKFHSQEITSVLSHVLSPVWIQIFAMTFLGEWGDRSQIATVAMGAGEGWLELLLGCLSGHFITTVIAVLGGKILAQHLSLRTITFSGAVCFLLFGVFYFRDWLEAK